VNDLNRRVQHENWAYSLEVATLVKRRASLARLILIAGLVAAVSLRFVLQS